MTKNTQLSNSFSTGGGGIHFEDWVQASFVVLMLTGGYAPALPNWPIVEIELQGKVSGFQTDDCIVCVENSQSKERRKLLGQIKSSINITKKSTPFAKVMQAAWSDFNNPKVFTKGKDIMALITGPLSATDAHNVQWLLKQAKATKDVEEFFLHVEETNFSPSKSVEKLKVIEHHLNKANKGKNVSKDEIYDFLNHFHLLQYDLGNRSGVVLSLIHSHISQFQLHHPQSFWPTVVDFVTEWNETAGTITPKKIPDNILEFFVKQKTVVEMPNEFKVVKGVVQDKPKSNWDQHPEATYLARAILMGSWQDQNSYDQQAITELLGIISYDEWRRKAMNLLHQTDSPLSHKNGIWKVVERAELWSQLGSYIMDQNLDVLRSQAVCILKELDPAFELPAKERYTANLRGKMLNYSPVLRQGIAEGLAILGSQPEACRNCPVGKAEVTCVGVIQELLSDANWVLWASLNRLLPALAEAAPGEFLKAVEKALNLDPCPFDELFSQEGNGITGDHYLTGLLWALEGLAWDKDYLVRVCVALAKLASHDPGGPSAHRPFNSLTSILLPWLPQTLAPVDKRRVAVETILDESPRIAWNLIIQLLPDQQTTSFGSYKPSWRRTIPDDKDQGVTQKEYQEQVSYYAELAVTAAGQEALRLGTLIDRFDKLPEPAFEQLLQVISSQRILDLPEEQRLSIWQSIIKCTTQHRRSSDAKPAGLDERMTRMEQIAESLAPTDLFNLYQHLFIDRDRELYEENGDGDEQSNKLRTRRECAVLAILHQQGIEGIIRFVEWVSSPRQLGCVLGVLADPVIEPTLLPHFLEDATDNRRKAFVGSFICQRYHDQSWNWCDNLDKANWTPEQVGQFLAYLPFTKGVWERAGKWLGTHERAYWTRTSLSYEGDWTDLALAIDKLIEHGRPHAAIECLGMCLAKQLSIDSDQCVRALLSALTSTEPSYTIDDYHIVELIKFLQAKPLVNPDDLFRVEWAYFPLLNRHWGAAPTLLETKLANDPEFFCEVIRLIYHSKKEVDQPSIEPNAESTKITSQAYRLLEKWRIPPGTQPDRTLNQERFTQWLQKVKQICTESGHLENALSHIGAVLFYTPSDPDNLWIDRVVARAFNEADADSMRTGFHTGAHNSRGVHWVDPTGKPEQELAQKFRRHAEEIENAGFWRFAVSLRELANSYDAEAKCIVHDASDEEKKDAAEQKKIEEGDNAAMQAFLADCKNKLDSIDSDANRHKDQGGE
ncbi:MAG: hypothetical protein QM520_01275 [Gammaproteobacteria bacterium]|nr:hypothetical protein [Gammaproteobacteria bacterium]